MIKQKIYWDIILVLKLWFLGVFFIHSIFLRTCILFSIYFISDRCLVKDLCLSLSWLILAIWFCLDFFAAFRFLPCLLASFKRSLTSGPAGSFEIFSRNESIGLSTMKSEATFSSIPEEFKMGLKSGGISGFLKMHYDWISNHQCVSDIQKIIYIIKYKISFNLTLSLF